MAITSPNRVGQTRFKLALLFEQSLLGVRVSPQDLESQNPAQSNQYTDLCRWTGYGSRNTQNDVYFYSWCKMGDCVRHGIGMERDKLIGESYEVFSEE